MVLLLVMLLIIEVSLVRYSILLSLGQTSPMLFSKFVCTCMIRGSLTSLRLSAFYATCVVRLTMVFFFGMVLLQS